MRRMYLWTTSLGRRQVLGWGLLAASLPLVEVRSFSGPFLLLTSLAFLFLASRRAFLLGVAFAVPFSTIAWDLTITHIGTRTLDARLLVTFGVAALVALALAVERSLPSRLELVGFTFVAWMLTVGALQSDSVLTWAPPLARWFSYVGVLMLARRWTRDSTQAMGLAIAVGLGFAFPATLGLIQFLVGESGFLNGAVRATAPGGRGPIGLAFGGQMLLILAFALIEARASARLGWLAGVALGAMAIIASATRIITVTAWLALASLAAAKRRWRTLAVVSVIFVVALGARPDLLSRYWGTITPTSAPSVEPGQSPLPSGTPSGEQLVFDPSLRFRLFVWETVLDEWAEQPVLGIGPGMTAPTVAAVSPARRTAPHNDYIGVLAELGLPGILLFVALQGGVLISLLRRWHATDGPLQAILSAVAALFLAVNVLGALNNPMYFFDVQLTLWALIGACLGAATPPSVATHVPIRDLSESPNGRRRVVRAGRRQVGNSCRVSLDGGKKILRLFDQHDLQGACQTTRVP